MLVAATAIYGAERLVITELMFNPPRDGYDYVEGYNDGGDSIDLSTLFIANRNQDGEIAGRRPLSNDRLMLGPGKYFVATANTRWLRQRYRVSADALVCEVTAMPSFPDDEGEVLLIGEEGNLFDEVRYSEKWHHPLLSEREGVALERISFEMPSSDPWNWASASASGYGTPGSANSQYSEFVPLDEGMSVAPEVFTPDSDGTDDFVLIRFKAAEPGFVINLIIYDVAGRKVRYLLKNRLLGREDQFRWDGLDDAAKALPAGIYILNAVVFNTGGAVRKYKTTVALGRRAG